MFFGLFSALERRRQWHPTPVLLAGKSHGWRGLVGYSPWGQEESDTSDRLHFHFSLSCTGEGNGSPLQYSCLENPRDGGAWWAAVYGVTQSWRRLTWLSSSSSFGDHEKVVGTFRVLWTEKVWECLEGTSNSWRKDEWDSGCRAPQNIAILNSGRKYCVKHIKRD